MTSNDDRLAAWFFKAVLGSIAVLSVVVTLAVCVLVAVGSCKLVWLIISGGAR